MQPSRHLEAIRRRLAPDFICAAGVGLGIGVVVTRRELITCKMRLFGGASIRRYAVGDIDSIWLRRGQSVGFLMVGFVNPDDPPLMLLFSALSLTEFEAVAASLERLARPRTVAHGPRRTRRRMVMGAPARAVAHSR